MAKFNIEVELGWMKRHIPSMMSLENGLWRAWKTPFWKRQRMKL